MAHEGVDHLEGGPNKLNLGQVSPPQAGWQLRSNLHRTFARLRQHSLDKTLLSSLGSKVRTEDLTLRGKKPCIVPTIWETCWNKIARWHPQSIVRNAPDYCHPQRGITLRLCSWTWAHDAPTAPKPIEAEEVLVFCPWAPSGSGTFQ